MTATDAAAIREALSGDLAELRRGQEKLGREVHQVNEALTGNGLGVSHGLIGCVKTLEECVEGLTGRVSAIENRWNHVKWVLFGIALGSGIGAGALVDGLIRAIGH